MIFRMEEHMLLKRILWTVALGLIICLNNEELNGQYALSFDGSNDYAYYDGAFAPTDIDYGTIEFWVKRTTSWGTILAKESDWGSTKYHIGLGDNQAGLFCQPIGYKWLAYAPNQNVWGHVAFVENDVETKVYINGKYVGILPGGMVINSGYDGSDFIIGACNHYGSNGGDQEFFGGIIDEIRIWNTVRTQTEIRDNMHKEVSTSSSGLVGYFKMSNGSGTSLTDDKNTPNNTLTINGATWVTSTAPIGNEGAYVNTTSQTSIGPSGGQIKVTITSTPGDANNLGVYQFGSVSGEPVTGETYPGGIDKRSNIVWGITERGAVTANLVFDYSNVGGIGSPSTIKLLKRSDASSTTWEEVSLTSRDNDARTLTVNGVTTFSEFALGAGSDNSLPVSLTTFTAKLQSGAVLLSWTTESETENLGFIIERKIVGANHNLPSDWSQIASYVTNKSLAGHGSTSAKHEYQYTDKAVQPGATYLYRLTDVDYSGKVTWHKQVEVKIEAQDAQIPEKFGLQPVYPNPFNPALTIPYGLTEDGQMTLKVYNLRGQLVETLMNTNALKGTYSYTWQPLNLSAGIYFIQLQSGNKTNMQKIVFAK